MAPKPDGPATGPIIRDALGRPVFMGQLYNAYTGGLINDSLFSFADMQNPNIVNVKQESFKTNLTFKVLQHSEDREDMLQISGSVSVSIMSGALNAKGSADYLNRTESSESTAGLATKFHGTKNIATLRRDKVDQFVVLTPEKLSSMGATHVVSSITYGAGIIASLAQSNASMTHDMTLNASASIDLIKSLGAFGSASGSATIGATEKEKLLNEMLEVRLLGDYLEGDQPEGAKPVPLTVTDMTNKMAVAPRLLQLPNRDAMVPITMELLPVKSFNRVSTVLLYKRIEEDALRRLKKLYDSMIVLEKARIALADVVQLAPGRFFPSFRADCTKRAASVTGLVVRARGSLGSLFKNYAVPGGVDGSTTMKALSSTVERQFNEEQKTYKADLQKWGTLMGLVEQGTASKMPFKTVSDLVRAMSRPVPKPVAVVLVPEGTHVQRLMNMYSGLNDKITYWAWVMSGSDQPPPSNDEDQDDSAIMRCTIYVDPALDAALALLDNSMSTLMNAINRARDIAKPVLLSSGLVPSVTGLVDWTGSGTDGRDGWGVLFGEDFLWRFIGGIRNGRPHGLGTKEDGENIWEGMWFDGRLDGYGSHRTETKTGGVTWLGQGYYVDGVLEANARMVQVTVIQDGRPIDTVKVAVKCVPGLDYWNQSNDYVAYARAIEELIPAQIRKIGRALDWSSNRRHRIRSLFSSPHRVSSIGGPNERKERVAGNRIWHSDISVITQGEEVMQIDPGWRRDMVQSIEREPWLDCLYIGSGRDAQSLNQKGQGPAQVQMMEAIVL